LRVSEKTFDTFLREDEDAREAWDGGKEEGKISLRRKQLRLAEKSAGMAIFLGKNYLDQADRHEITGAQGGPLQYQNLSEDDLNAKLIALFAGASPGAAHGEEAGASEPDGGSLDMEDDPGGEE
jgi:hypothetical protein